MNRKIIALPLVGLMFLSACGGTDASSTTSGGISVPPESSTTSSQTSQTTSSIDTDGVIKLADVLALENGAEFTSRAVYMGGSDMVNEQYGTYNAIYVADGATPYLLYRMDADLLPADAVIGETVFEFEGTVANYTNDDDVTTHECSVQSLKVVEDDSVLPGVELVLDADHQVEITEENINKKVAVTGGVVTTKTSDNFGNININFTVGEGSYKIKIDSRYGRTDTDELTALKAGDTFNCKTFISANQFEYAEGLTITATGGDVPPTPPVDESYVTELVSGNSYKLGLYQETAEKWAFVNGEMSTRFVATVENYAEAPDFVITAVTDGYTLQVKDTQKYLGTVYDGSQYTNPGYVDDPYTWQWNTEYYTFTTKVGEDVKYLGAYSNYTTLSLSNLSYAANEGNFVMHAYNEDPRVVTEAPEAVKTTVADLLADPKGNTLYELTGVAEGLANDKWGNGYITDPESGLSIKLYGNTTTATALTWDGTKWDYSNPQDSETTLKDLKNGDTITIQGIWDTNHKNLSAVTTKITPATGDETYAVTIEETTNGTVTANPTTAAYGATVTLTITPNANYQIDKISIDHGYTKETISVSEDAYTFTATAVNKVTVVFADPTEIATTFTITKEAFPALTNSYADVTGTINVNGTEVTLDGHQIYDGGCLQLRNKNNNPSLISNTVAIPGKITSITVNFMEGKNLPAAGNFGIATGEAVVTSVSDFGEYAQSVTYTAKGSSDSYFAVGHTGADTGSMYIESIVVNFTPNA